MQQQLGSGKTTVLVERIVNKIINEKIDIDKLLIVTFTNAAASEMRERILEAIYEKIEENPDDVNLQRQIMLLNKASISTIHAFCLEVIKNYFYEIGISSNFRIGDTSEIELLKQETLEELFDDLYEEQNEEFIKLVNVYGGYRDDENLKNIILKIYNYSQSMPFPEEWICESIEKFNLKDKLDIDFSKTVWGQELIKYFNDEIYSNINKLEKVSLKLQNELELEKYYSVITDDICKLKNLVKEENTWNDIYNILSNIKFETWPRQSKTDCDLKTKCKETRDEIRDSIKSLSKRIFISSSEEVIEDISSIYDTLRILGEVILRFNNKYQESKKEKNIIDFNDIEHYALKILVKKDEKGSYLPTNIANVYKEKFVEIAIDEYQDSNLVQEYILTTISNDNNIFMVGDVKQSIYKFRQARPELFLEKYNQYILAEDKENICHENTKIQLFKNFRSRKNILDITNIIFNDIMSEKLGDIDYNEKEYLNYGANYLEPDENINTAGKVELDVIDLLESEEELTEENNYDNEEDKQVLEKSEVQAKFVANRIRELIDSNYYIYDKKQGYRKVTYRDIVILLRTTSNIAQIYERELNNLQLPVFSDTSSNYFETEEIQVILSALKIIDNPNSDIPLVTVLRSPIANFTDNELVEIRLCSKDTSYYEALCAIKNSDEKKALKEKVISFLTMLDDWQQKQEYLQLDELIWYIYENTSYFDIINSSKNGELKTANLKLLFEKARDYQKASFKGLYNFINYVDKISKSSGDVGSAKLIGENENVIRIMSIHKSKGLEFPVVFLCSTEKQFNVQDLNENILLHQDMGFGPKVIDYERKIEYNTLAKEAIRIKSLNEILSEEMRLLYVALTRAKEKLIIVGCDKNLNKSLSLKENMISDIYEEKISASSIRKGKSYLDWIELVYIKNQKRLDNLLEINFYNKDVIKVAQEKAQKEYEEEEKNISLDGLEKSKMIRVEEILNWKYKYIKDTKIEGKASVSELAKGEQEENIEITTKPKFLRESLILTNAEIGTLMHLVMQKLDFRQDYDISLIQELINSLIYKNLITEVEATYIDINKILLFTKSDIYSELKSAKEIYKEKPFYLYVAADEIYKNGIKEKILVQGIIDLYYINQSDEITLVDYKTDYIKVGNEEKLIKKYRKQLNIYKRALEQSLNKQVKSVYIYSICLEKKIEVRC